MMHIDDLPVDIWEIIFKKLSIFDLLNCRLVNKKFKEFSDFTNGIYRLSISKYISCGSTQRWSYNNSLISIEDKINFNCFQIIRSLSLFNLDRNLRYLIIDCYDGLRLDDLSSLINLEYLNISYSTLREMNHSLNSKNLKYLKIDSQHLNGLINLNTPKLKKFKYENIKEINFISNPISIQHFITNNYQNELKIFKNLQILELNYFDSYLNDNLLSIFNNLKRFIIKYEKFDGKLEDNLINLFNEMKNLNRSIDIFYNDLKIENIHKFNMYRSCGESLKFKINCDQSELLSDKINHLAYFELERCFDNLRNDLPDSFFDKFANLFEIFLTDSENQANDIIWFLSNLKDLRDLSMMNCVSFELNFYYNLPTTIKILGLKFCKIIDYDFIFRFKNLITFSNTGVNIDQFDLAFKSFLNLKYLIYFRFRLVTNLGHKYIEITKLNYKFGFEIRSTLIRIFKLDYDQLVELCNKFREMNYNFTNLYHFICNK